MAQRYQILFKGEILTGFDPIRVRADAASLLNAGPQQLAQLFSGSPVGIRKNLLAADAARYRSTLSRIGLRIYVNAMSAAHAEEGLASAAAGNERASYRIAYSGEVLPGLLRATVMQRVAQKLALDDARLNRLFSGKPVVLKKGLSAGAATSYLKEAAQLGMRASMEIETAAGAPLTSVAAASAPPETARRFMESAVKTQLYAPRAPFHDQSMSRETQAEISTMVDIDLMRSVAEPVESTICNVLDEPMPQVKIWRPQMAPASVAAGPASTPAFDGEEAASVTAQPELALRSIALHSAADAPSQSTPAARRHPALHRLAAMGALLPKALSRILQ